MSALTSEFTEILLGQKCRPHGANPPAAEANREDYFYTVVACWLEPRAFSQVDATPIGFRLMCGLVSDGTGGTNVIQFLDLEFLDIK